MRRRQQEQLKKVALGMFAATLVLIVALGVILIKRKQRWNELQEQWLAAQNAQGEEVVVEEPDPYDDLGEQAIAKVRAVAVQGTDGPTTIGARIGDGALTTRVEALARPGVSDGEWRAKRLQEHTVYQVDFVHTFHSVEFGPTWYVQMDAEGPAPEGSSGVVPVNGLAKHLHAPDLDEGLRYLNRADEVLQALTEHRFRGGTRLGSALLVFFAGRADETERRIIGWHVVPEATDPGEELLYRAFFQWEEGGVIQDAWWEVNLLNRDFRARDLQANEIMAMGESVAASDVVDIRPRTMDLSEPPSRERDPRRRALRHLLANDRLVEAVGTLLGFRARNVELEYVGWEPQVTAERHVYDLACIFKEGDDEVRVTWRVDANSGETTPTSDIAVTAQLALELVEEEAGDEG